jgi:hypothetical protein
MTDPEIVVEMWRWWSRLDEIAVELVRLGRKESLEAVEQLQISTFKAIQRLDPNESR